ncbi:cell division protein FtsL [Desulfuromonas versatilis]|uniref:Cell division protein FtsL n=1 Tax=Desulfuromonas versatilis TaxID=2802975 RepID=A0ABM8HQB4_9BACT|nr:cell division protein FtsL [Desulfuromonas versatilis]BCR03955.1 cell division protein FtsL [Desulfuromonas versatilis]
MSNVSIKSLPKINGFSLSRPRILPLLVSVTAIMAVSLFFVWSRIEAVNLEYAISSHESRLRELNQESRQLRLEVASLRNPLRIEQVARKELGLRMPTPNQVIIVE